MADIQQPDYDAMLAQVREFQEQILRAERQIIEARQQSIVDSIRSLPDGFWLAGARDVLQKMVNQNRNGVFGSADVHDCLYRLDNLIQQLARAKAHP